MTFDNAFNFTMKYEVGSFWNPKDPDVIAGLCDTPSRRIKTGYVNDPKDRGGETKFGIAKKANPGVDIKKLDLAGAKAIYEKNYWKAAKCDLFSPKVSFAMFDAAVNHGPRTAAKMLQRAVGAVVDGAIGPGTMKAVNAKSQDEVLKLMLADRRRFFNAIVTNDQSQAKFLKGWLNRVADIEKTLV